MQNINSSGSKPNMVDMATQWQPDEDMYDNQGGQKEQQYQYVTSPEINGTSRFSHQQQPMD